MKLSNYFPTFRNILVQEVTETKTEGGIYIPSSAFGSVEDKTYKVLKTGKDCIEVQPGDNIRLSPGANINKIMLRTGGVVDTYLQVLEMAVVGIERDDSIRNAPATKSKVARSSKLQTR